jgi:hypothetical protein
MKGMSNRRPAIDREPGRVKAGMAAAMNMAPEISP